MLDIVLHTYLTVKYSGHFRIIRIWVLYKCSLGVVEVNLDGRTKSTTKVYATHIFMWAMCSKRFGLEYTYVLIASKYQYESDRDMDELILYFAGYKKRKYRGVNDRVAF